MIQPIPYSLCSTSSYHYSTLISCVLFFEPTESTQCSQDVCGCGAVYWGMSSLSGAPSLKNTIISFSQLPSTAYSSSASDEACDLLPNHSGIRYGFILHRSYTFSHSCFGIMWVTFLSWPENIFSL